MRDDGTASIRDLDTWSMSVWSRLSNSLVMVWSTTLEIPSISGNSSPQCIPQKRKRGFLLHGRLESKAILEIIKSNVEIRKQKFKIVKGLSKSQIASKL